MSQRTAIAGLLSPFSHTKARGHKDTEKEIRGFNSQCFAPTTLCDHFLLFFIFTFSFALAPPPPP
ncbi:MAG: hypothetical protein FWD36_08000, partial [Treponema sp.]|nr:hypothetical protein [Treponema sp.]